MVVTLFLEKLKPPGGYMSCGICKKGLLDTDIQIELECGKHLAHSVHNSFDCLECSPPGKTIDGAVLGGGGGKADSSAIERRKQLSAQRVGEPLVGGGGGGRQPVEQSSSSSILSSVTTAFSKHVVPLFSRTGAPLESLPPRELLAKKVPLADLVSRYGYDITELINDHQLTINDFFEHEYTIGEMIDAFSSRMNAREGLDVLSALGIQAEHFRCVPDLVMADVMKKRIGYKPSDLVDRFHFQYKSPVTQPEEAWTLQEMVNAGLTFEDVRRAGMQCEVQWNELKQTAAPLALPRLEREFGISQELIKSQLIPEAISAQMATGFLTAQRIREQQQQQEQRQREAEQERARNQYVMAEILRHHAPVSTQAQQQQQRQPQHQNQNHQQQQQQQQSRFYEASPTAIAAARQNPIAFASMIPVVVQNKK